MVDFGPKISFKNGLKCVFKNWSQGWSKIEVLRLVLHFGHEIGPKFDPKLVQNFGLNIWLKFWSKGYGPKCLGPF